MIDTLAFLRLGLPCSFFFAINEKRVLKVKKMKSGVTPLTRLLDNLGLLWQKSIVIAEPGWLRLGSM